MARVFTIYVMCENNESAMHLATSLVNEKLVACANVKSGVRSLYLWEGSLQLDEEYNVIMKTSEDVLNQAIDRIKELHHYDIPCITAWPVEAGDVDYLDWVNGQVSQPVDDTLQKTA